MDATMATATLRTNDAPATRSAPPAVHRQVTFGPVVAATLAVGLLIAIVTDGRLPAPWDTLLFAALFVLDLVTIEWLTRARPAPSATPREA